jgi:hypothetical protein
LSFCPGNLCRGLQGKDPFFPAARKGIALRGTAVASAAKVAAGALWQPGGRAGPGTLSRRRRRCGGKRRRTLGRRGGGEGGQGDKEGEGSEEEVEEKEGEVLEGGEGADDDEYEKAAPPPSAEDNDGGDGSLADIGYLLN